ncbi:hypothetical protein [Paraburkholderia sp. SIMBA_054]|uniref:hypothetical protein n=1 Tax=Paraburkholderia sp. SIMBA_054 TaxID=3085795 RepID=UPI00397D1ACB
MRKFYEVCFRWNNNDSEEGTFTETTFANDEDDAEKIVATSMAHSSDSGINADDPDALARYVAEASDRLEYVTDLQLSIPHHIESVFFDELYPDGKRRQLNMEALAELPGEHRDRVLAPAR